MREQFSPPLSLLHCLTHAHVNTHTHTLMHKLKYVPKVSHTLNEPSLTVYVTLPFNLAISSLPLSLTFALTHISLSKSPWNPLFPLTHTLALFLSHLCQTHSPTHTQAHTLMYMQTCTRTHTLPMRDGSKDKHISSIIDSKAIIRLSLVRFRVRHQMIKILFLQILVFMGKKKLDEILNHL